MEGSIEVGWMRELKIVPLHLMVVDDCELHVRGAGCGDINKHPKILAGSAVGQKEKRQGTDAVLEILPNLHSG